MESGTARPAVFFIRLKTFNNSYIKNISDLDLTHIMVLLPINGII